MAEGAVLEVAPKPIHKTPEHVLARKRPYRQRNAEKIRVRRAAHYQANLKQERAKGRAAADRWREQQREKNRLSIDELKLFQVDPLREERLKQSDLVTCRECGGKYTDLHHHLAKYHKVTLQEYLERWNDPPISAPSLKERQRERAKRQFKGNYFGGKRYVLKPGEGATAKRGEPSTPAMRRHAMRLRMVLSGRPRPDRLGKKRKNGVWVQAEPVDDARIAALRLTGRSNREIAAEVDLTDAAVFHRLKCLGFPPGRACLFLYGEPVAKQHFLDLCNDFGLTKKSAIGLAKRSYFSVLNHLSHLQSADTLTAQLAHSFLRLRKTLADTHCFYEVGGKQVRHFLRSELRDLPALRTRVRHGLNALRVWMRSNPAAQPTNVLNWLCMQSREEVAGRGGTEATAHVFRGLLFLWPSLKALNEKKPGLLAGRRFIDEAVDEVLSIEYGAAPSRIAQAAQGGLTALDPRTLGRNILEERPAPAKKSQGGRPARKRKLFLQAAELYKQLDSWGLVAMKLVPAEYQKDPRGAADRLRLGAKHIKQLQFQTPSEKT